MYSVPPAVYAAIESRLALVCLRLPAQEQERSISPGYLISQEADMTPAMYARPF